MKMNKRCWEKINKCKTCGKILANHYAIKCKSCVKKGKGHWNWKGGKSICKNCGKITGCWTAKLCQKCFNKTKKGKSNSNYKSGLPKCKKCGKLLTGYKYTYCLKCWQKIMKGKDNPNYKGGKPKCKKCGERVSSYSVNLCWNCYSKKTFGKNNNNWMGGKSYEPYTSEFNETLKESIKQRDGYKCQKCGVPQQECIIKLAVHHIDYNKNNCKPNNLITVCRECNSKINADREKWEKHFKQKVKEKGGIKNE